MQTVSTKTNKIVLYAQKHTKGTSYSLCNHVYQHVLRTFTLFISAPKMKADHQRAYQLT